MRRVNLKVRQNFLFFFFFFFFFFFLEDSCNQWMIYTFLLWTKRARQPMALLSPLNETYEERKINSNLKCTNSYKSVEIESKRNYRAFLLLLSFFIKNIELWVLKISEYLYIYIYIRQPISLTFIRWYRESILIVHTLQHTFTISCWVLPSVLDRLTSMLDAVGSDWFVHCRE